VIKLNRDQAMAVGALSVLVLTCVLVVGWSVQIRSDAAQELNDNREMLASFEARRAHGTDAGGRSGPALAPVAAFVNAPTQGLAGAQLQAYFATVVSDQHATLISSGAEPTSREDAPDVIRIQATLDITMRGLQAVLYQLESSTPYVFVDSLTVATSTPTGQRGNQDPVLRVALRLRALWRREMA
jgi:general secretion pathway protein M